jgi:hypothetical protein
VIITYPWGVVQWSSSPLTEDKIMCSNPARVEGFYGFMYALLFFIKLIPVVIVCLLIK